MSGVRLENVHTHIAFCYHHTLQEMHDRRFISSVFQPNADMVQRLVNHAVLSLRDDVCKELNEFGARMPNSNGG